MCCLNGLLNEAHGTQVNQTDKLAHFKRAAIAFGIIALILAIAIAVLICAPHIATIGVIGVAVAFCGGITNIYIGLGVLTGVSVIAALFFRGYVNRHSS
jgi:hypothetical protein